MCAAPVILDIFPQMLMGVVNSGMEPAAALLLKLHALQGGLL